VANITAAWPPKSSTSPVSDIIVPSGWRERVEELQSRRSGWVVAGFVVVAVTVALVMWVRGAPAQIAPPATEPPASFPSPATAVASPTAALLYVDVSGAVRKPGLYRLPAGSRVADAVEAAGGPARRADLEALNLAQPLTDGLKVDVASRGVAASGPIASAGSVAPAGAAPSSSVPVVNINTADEPTLELIPGVGPVTANAILAYRDRIGRFSAIEQLLEVNGIGPATIENIRPYISI
jgi:competence protein ComEA